MGKSAAIISKYSYFNSAFVAFLQELGYFDRVEAINQPFGFLDSEQLGKTFQVFFSFSQEICQNRLVDIGVLWGEYLTRYGLVYLIDFETEGDFSANPVMINPLRQNWQKQLEIGSPNLPVRRLERQSSSYLAEVQGLFRAHGPSFLGELGKLRSYLIGGMELLEDNGDATLWPEYFDPCLKWIATLTSIFHSFWKMLSLWPDKACFNRLQSALDTIATWPRAIKDRDIEGIGKYEQTAAMLDSVEQDILRFKV